MSRERIIRQLQYLRPESSVYLRNSVIVGMTRSLGAGVRNSLIRSRPNPDGYGFIYVPTNGANSLLNPNNITSRRRLMVLDQETSQNFTHSLNDALSGSDNYPVLTAVLGVAAGLASFGAGLLFTASTTALSLAQPNHRVLARGGDQLYQVEEIGKVINHNIFSADSVDIVHISAIFLVDPHRNNYRGIKSWLIHEERQILTLVLDS